MNFSKIGIATLSIPEVIVDEVHFVLDQHAYLDFYSASLLKQRSAD
jgi:hypothetical protein